MKISEIINNRYGELNGFLHFTDSTWRQFLLRSINKALLIAETKNDRTLITVCQAMIEMANEIIEPAGHLIWSDFSCDNIIVDKDGHLSGFIDFDSLISGDPILGLGYFFARSSRTVMRESILKALGIPQISTSMNFYSILRWCRLIPYLCNPLPNGQTRMPLREYLPYSYNLIYGNRSKTINGL